MRYTMGFKNFLHRLNKIFDFALKTLTLFKLMEISIAGFASAIFVFLHQNSLFIKIIPLFIAGLAQILIYIKASRLEEDCKKYLQSEIKARQELLKSKKELLKARRIIRKMKQNKNSSSSFHSSG